MKILFCSYTFAPNVGGIETVGRLLVQEFRAAGHEVRVLTHTPGDRMDGVHRQPGLSEIRSAVQWADVIFHNNISLRYAWPLLLARKPWVVAHHTWLRPSNTGKDAASRLKELCIRRAHNVAVSAAVARALPVRACVIGNPYDADQFRVRRDVSRTRDLVFVGRLVSDKGADVLLEALRLVHLKGVNCNLSIVGDGPKRDRLVEQVTRAGLEGKVLFHGTQTGADLSLVLNQHRVLVVPSRWNEPFGVVALEAIACGCAVIGTNGGGLPDAISRCGVTVPNGDAAALAFEIERLIRNPEIVAGYTTGAEAHLKQHHPVTVAQRYLELFDELRA